MKNILFKDAFFYIKCFKSSRQEISRKPFSRVLSQEVSGLNVSTLYAKNPVSHYQSPHHDIFYDLTEAPALMLRF